MRHRNIRELTGEELNELRWHLYWNLAEHYNDDSLCVGDITDEMVIEAYDGIIFTEDDFICNY